MSVFRAARADSPHRAAVVLYLTDLLESTRFVHSVVERAHSVFRALTGAETDAQHQLWCVAAAQFVHEYTAGIVRWHASTSPPVAATALRTRVDEYYRAVESGYRAVAEAFAQTADEAGPGVHEAGYRLFVERYRNYSAIGVRANREFLNTMRRFRIADAEILPQPEDARR